MNNYHRLPYNKNHLCKIVLLKNAILFEGFAGVNYVSFFVLIEARHDQAAITKLHFYLFIP